MQKVNQSANAAISNWHLIYTYPHLESRVQKLLVKENIECFLPLQKVTKKWSDRIKVMEVPLFPNYIYVFIAKNNRYKVLDVSGVSYFVASGRDPVIVSETEIETIKKIVSGNDIRVDQKLDHGDFVQVIKGPLAGLKGQFFGKKGKTRLGIRVKGINSTLSIAVCRSSVVRLAETVNI